LSKKHDVKGKAGPTAMPLKRRIAEAAATVRQRTKLKPKVGIILGTGLGGLAKRIRDKVAIPYDEIPHFAASTVSTHEGNLVLGKLAGKSIVAMEGRFHPYEGHSADAVTFPVRVVKALGAKVLIVSNACGGMNPQYRRGDLMIIEDHINLMGINPLVGPHDDSLGPRFPDMSQPYDRELIDLASDIALHENIRAHTGVYVGVMGPNLETRAEYRFLRGIGADVVGMSTVPEVIVAVQAGLRTLGVSVITDMCLPDALKPADINEIIAVANEAETKLTRLIHKVIDKIIIR